MTLSNPASQNMTSKPVLIHVTFPVAHLVDAASELTLTYENGTVVPSYVVDQTTSGGFVSSVWLMVIVSIQARSNQTYWLYYGDITAVTPPYRIQTQAATFTSGLLAITQQSSSPGSFYYQLSYGETYSETILSRVSYGTQARNQFGTLEISANPLQQIAPWRAIANDSRTQLLATLTTFAAPDLHVDRVDILTGSNVSTIYLVRNAGNTTLNDVNLVNVLDTSPLASITPSYTLFDSSGGSLTTTVGDVLVGFGGSLHPSAFGLGPYGQVVNQTRADSFNSQARYYGPSAGALSWGLGSLEPGSTAEFGTSWSVSSNMSDLKVSLDSFRSSPIVKVGAEETLQSLFPTANVYWKSSLSINNVAFGSGGLALPMTIQGGRWFPESATLSGELSYFTPAPDFDPAYSGLWSASSKATGNATAAASAAFFSVQNSEYLGRISSTTSNSSGTAVSSLVSSRQVVLGNQPAEFNLTYRATFSVGVNASAQAFFAAIDIDHTLAGVYDESLLLPVSGSSGNLACPQDASTSFSHPVVSTYRNLVANGSWITLPVPLGSASSALGFGFRIRFCASIGRGFVGSMELSVKRARVNVKTSTDGVVLPGLSEAVPMASLGLAPQMSSIPSNANMSGNLSFMLATDGTMAQQGGISFSTNPMAAPTVRLNGSAGSKGSFQLRTSVESVLVATSFASLGPTLYVGGSRVFGASVPRPSNDSLFAPGEGLAGAWNNSKRSTIIGVTFAGYVLRVTVTDENGSPVRGANLTISYLLALANSNLTNHEGVASVQLVPWTYNMSVRYQGLVVATNGDYSLVGNSTLNLNATVIQTNLSVKNALGSPLGDVLVTAVGANGSAPIQGVTDQSGRFSFQAPEGGIFHVTITSGGSTYFKGDIKAIANKGVIVITTSYYPETLWIGITVAVTAALIALVAAYYFHSTRTNRKASE